MTLSVILPLLSPGHVGLARRPAGAGTGLRGVAAAARAAASARPDSESDPGRRRQWAAVKAAGVTGMPHWQFSPAAGVPLSVSPRRNPAGPHSESQAVHLSVPGSMTRLS